MTEEKKKRLSSTIREFYLYPYRTKEENLVRGTVWIASWIVGIVVQNAMNQKAMGGAYFIFASSLLLEFVPQSRTKVLTRFVHALFSSVLLVILVCGLFLSFGDAVFRDMFGKLAFTFGWIFFVMLCFGIVLSLCEAHKCFFDEEAEKERKAEKQRDEFMNKASSEREVKP